jgi:hypothetical protein
MYPQQYRKAPYGNTNVQENNWYKIALLGLILKKDEKNKLTGRFMNS